MNLHDTVTSNRGRETTFEAFYVRPLSEADLPYILSPPKTVSTGLSIMNIRERHHSAARLFAEGRTNNEVAAITGYTPARLSSFKTSPDFMDLVRSYAAQKEMIFLDVHARKAELASTVISELQDRLEDSPKTFSNRELSELLKVAADQGEATKTPPSIAVNISFTQPALQQALDSKDDLLDITPANTFDPD